jgi:beta-xylosidase
LHYFRDAFWITFAMNDEHVGLLKSSTGKAEGPYGEMGLIGHRLLGGDPSLFADTDGAVYFVWGQGYIARLNDELTALAEEPRSLQLAVAGYPNDETIVDASGERGAFVFKDGDKYHFVFSAWNRRDGAGHCDTFVCTAANITGPYSKPSRWFADTGQTTVFRDATGAFQAAWSVNDTLTIRRLP